MTTIADLIVPKTKLYFVNRLLELLAGADPPMPVSAWQRGSVPLTLLDLDAQVLADLEDNKVAELAKAAFLSTAEDAWADLHAASVYNDTRKAAVFTQGTLTLTDSAGVGPVTVSPGAFWVADSNTGKRFQNLTGGTINHSATLALTFQAESAGAAWNLGGGSVFQALTPIAGVTLNTAASDWIFQYGADRESDAALRTRLPQKWATLGTGSPADAYAYWAKTSSAVVTRVTVLDATPTPGQITLVLAGTGGPVDSGTVATVLAYIAPKVPVSVTLNVQSATANSVTVAGTYYAYPNNRARALAEVAANLDDLQNTLPIGATLYRAELIERVMDAYGVYNFVLDSPASDVVLTNTQVLTLARGGVVVAT